MADPKKNPLIGAFRAPVPGAPPDTPAPPEAGKPPAAGAAKPIDEKKGQEAPKAPAGTTPKPADGKKEPEAPKAPADTSPGRTCGGNAFLSGGRPGPAGGAAVLRPSRHTTRGGADYGTEAAYHAPESAPKPGECSKAGDRPERAQETAPPENGPGTVTAALAPLSAPAWHFDSKMPLVRGSAPDTPAPPKVPSI